MNIWWVFFFILQGNRACLFQTEVWTVDVSSWLFKGPVVISAATTALLITQEELYVSKNNRTD